MRLLRPLLVAGFLLAAACDPSRSTDLGTEPTPGMPPVEALTQQTLYVAPYTRGCTGEVQMQCLQVRENPSGEWQNFYDHIEGFSYQRGYAYELRVGWREVPNPPADLSSREYWLIRVVQKTRALP